MEKEKWLKVEDNNIMKLMKGIWENEIYIYNDGVYGVKTNLVRNINLSVCINKDKLTEGKGTKEEPYILKSEVQEWEK